MSGDSVLVVARDGSIVQTLHDPDNPGGASLGAASDRSLHELWPTAIARQIQACVKRALRSRIVQVERFDDRSAGIQHEILFIAKNRNEVLVIVRDIGADVNALLEIEQRAYFDETTRLPKRDFLLRELSAIIDTLRLREGRAAVICVDIDHPDLDRRSLAGSRASSLLAEVASRLLHDLRGANLPNTLDFERYSVVARVDSHRFAIVLPTIETGSDAEGVTQRLIDTLEKPIVVSSTELSVKAAAGIALFPQDGTEAGLLFDNSIAALEDAIHDPSERYRFHSGTVRVRALQRQDLELQLKSALANNEFSLDFLPIVDSSTGSAVSVEALLRWPQSVFKSHPIERVIAIAERTGQIVPIGDWVLRAACAQLRAWRDSGYPDLRLSVNLSVQEFSRGDLAARFIDALGGAGIEADAVDVEITEHLLFRDAINDFTTCRSLRELGCGVVVDDFGTGACSLEHLARSPVDGIKIENGLVARATSNDRDRAACAAAVAIGSHLGVRSIAEGVETAEQADLLRELGCRFLQGYWICRPAGAEGLDSFLRVAGADR